MWNTRVKSKAVTIKTNSRFARLSANQNVGSRAGVGYDSANPTPAVPTKLWQLALIGLCVIFSIMFIVWFAHGGVGSFSLTNAPISASDHSNNQKSLDRNKQQAIDADLYFERRARETEEGFNSAFPFHR